METPSIKDYDKDFGIQIYLDEEAYQKSDSNPEFSINSREKHALICLNQGDSFETKLEIAVKKLKKCFTTYYADNRFSSRAVVTTKIVPKAQPYKVSIDEKQRHEIYDRPWTKTDGSFEKWPNF